MVKCMCLCVPLDLFAIAILLRESSWLKCYDCSTLIKFTAIFFCNIVTRALSYQTHTHKVLTSIALLLSIRCTQVFCWDYLLSWMGENPLWTRQHPMHFNKNRIEEFIHKMHWIIVCTNKMDRRARVFLLFSFFHSQKCRNVGSIWNKRPQI